MLVGQHCLFLLFDATSPPPKNSTRCLSRVFRVLPSSYLNALLYFTVPLTVYGGVLSHTVLVVDDNAQVRRALRSLVEQSCDWKVCGEAEDGEAAVQKVKELHPDLVILDLQMPVMNGLEAAREIGRIAPNTIMVMFTMHNSNQLEQEARAAGVRDVLSKSGRVDVLLAALLTDFNKSSKA